MLGTAKLIRWAGKPYRVARLWLITIKDGDKEINITNPPLDDVGYLYETSINFTITNIDLTSNNLELTIKYTIVYRYPEREDEISRGIKVVNVSVQRQD